MKPAPFIASDEQPDRPNRNMRFEGAGLQPRHSPRLHFGALAPEGAD
jgi:hypothetical protein